MLGYVLTVALKASLLKDRGFMRGEPLIEMPPSQLHRVIVEQISQSFGLKTHSACPFRMQQAVTPAEALRIFFGGSLLFFLLEISGNINEINET